jgi:ABC-type molybdate transport system substrate-binding protein
MRVGNSYGRKVVRRTLKMRLVKARFFVASLLLLALLSLTTVALTGCGGSSGSQGGSFQSPSEGQETGGTLTVLAASSLTDAFGELVSMFEEQTPARR